jgi:tryptophan 2,3-dioxygenase
MDSSSQIGVLEASAFGGASAVDRVSTSGGASAASGVDPRLAFELRRWQSAEPGQAFDGYTLAWMVACHLRARGRDHLGEPLLAALADIARRHRGHDHFLDAYLDCVLARYQGRFGSRAYLASPLLELIMADRRSGLGSERLTVLLIADVIRYESQPESMAELDEYTRDTRALHSARYIAESEPALGSGAPTPPGTAAGEWMALTVLPVSAAHDEYVLIRALQAQELLFGLLTDMITSATEAARASDLLDAAAIVRRAHKVFRRAGTLARVVSTMRGADVEQLAGHVEGTSALRSEAYQRFVRACRTPAEGSPGRAQLTGGLAKALADQRGTVTSPELAELMDAMAALEASHQAWKAVHHGPAAAIIGAESGSRSGPGGTAAVLHVQHCMDNRLFGSDALREVFGPGR